MLVMNNPSLMNIVFNYLPNPHALSVVTESCKSWQAIVAANPKLWFDFKPLSLLDDIPDKLYTSHTGQHHHNLGTLQHCCRHQTMSKPAASCMHCRVTAR